MIYVSQRGVLPQCCFCFSKFLATFKKVYLTYSAVETLFLLHNNAKERSVGESVVAIL